MQIKKKVVKKKKLSQRLNKLLSRGFNNILPQKKSYYESFVTNTKKRGMPSANLSEDRFVGSVQQSKMAVGRRAVLWPPDTG